MKNDLFKANDKGRGLACLPDLHCYKNAASQKERRKGEQRVHGETGDKMRKVDEVTPAPRVTVILFVDSSGMHEWRQCMSRNPASR